MDDCKIFSESIRNLTVGFVKRSVNRVAHVLAKAVVSMSDIMSWGSALPSFFIAALVADVFS